MMLVHDAANRRNVALDGSSRAPNRAVPGTLVKAERLRGHAATTVPSTPAALGYALGRFGRKTLEEVLQPAIELAEDGYVITDLQHALARRERKKLRDGPAGSLFLFDGTRPYRAGETFRQPVLARTLGRLAKHGVEDFYNGGIARRIDRDMRANGGILHLDDLAQIPWPIERRPIGARLGTWRVLAFPPPGAGRMLVEILQILQDFRPDEYNPDTPRGALVLAEILHRAQLDRQDRPFDPQYFPQVRERRNSSPKYARAVAQYVRRRVRAGGETTHLSTMDGDGNTVALTQSIERVYGGGAASPELGFLYNNYMSAFEYEDISHPYYLRPNAVPWASVAPTIVLRGRRPWVALGSPGSERIASAVAQVLVRLARGYEPLDAVSAPRLHCSLDRVVSIEASRMRDDIPRELRARGFQVDVREPYSFYLGCVQLVRRGRKYLTGVADPRRDGSAMGM
jgi:gamma-glutamyltranspeptidase/glutathione hydrolase